MVAVRPKMKSTSEKLLGKNVLVFLNYGEAASEESPKWTLLGGQRSADYSASAEEIDLTDQRRLWRCRSRREEYRAYCRADCKAYRASSERVMGSV